MNLFDVAWADHLLLQADWTAERGNELIAAVNPGRVIIRRRQDEGEVFYLYPVREVQAQLQAASPGQIIERAIDLQQAASVAALEGSTSADTPPFPPYRAVVLEDGRPIGYIDATVVPDSNRLGWNKHYAAGSSEAAVTVQRYLQADLPGQVQLESTISLLVSLSAAPPARPTAPIAQPVGTSIDIVVTPRRGLVLTGKSEGCLVISDEDETPPLQFKLKAVELGPASVVINALREGQLVGRLMLQPTVVAELNENDDTSARHEVALIPKMHGIADLTILILQERLDGRLAFSFRVTARDPKLDLLAKQVGSFVPQGDPGQFFRQFYAEIDDLLLRPADAQHYALAGKGVYLYDRLVPAEIRSILTKQREQIKSIAVYTEEPWISWELCRPPDELGSSGAYLGETFALSRWIPGLTSPQPNPKLQHIALVVPTSSGLNYAAQERDFMLSLAGPTRQVTLIEPKFLPLSLALSSGKYDAWHFVGHGTIRSPDPDRAIIELDDGPFTPQDLTQHARVLREKRPFVFMNGCQIGQGGLALTTMGGWAREFIACGASAFIAPMWSVYDGPALGFAKAFYTLFLGDQPLAEAVRQARLVIKSTSNPTIWLAYAVYGDPFALVCAEPAG